MTDNDRLIAWSSSNTSEVWDRKLKQIVTLADVSELVKQGDWQSSYVINEKAFVWSTRVGPSSKIGTDNTITHIIDTTQLP